MKLYLVRHGRTQYNVEGRFGGSTDVPVTPEGLAQLRAAPFCPEEVYVSPLIRARQSAAVIFPDAAQVVVRDLQEMNFGEFEGKTYYEMQNDPDFMRWMESRGTEESMQIVCRGGESRGQFTRRVRQALIGLVESALAAGKPYVAVVAHGGTQMAALYSFTDEPILYHEGETRNGGCRVLETDPELWRAGRRMKLVDTLLFAEEA